MRILLCTSTFKGVTHGPAKFAQLLMKINDLYPDHQLRILTKDIDTEVPNLIYKIAPKYWKPVYFLWPFFDNYFFDKAAKIIYEYFPFDVLLYNNAILGYWTAKGRFRKWKVMGMVNDDDYLTAKLFGQKWNKKWLINFHRKILENLACSNLDGVIANSIYVQKAIFKTYNCKLDKLFRLYKSINLDNFTYKDNSNINVQGVIRILFVKSDFPRGGLKMLVESLELIPYKFELIIIGPQKKFAPAIHTFFSFDSNVKNIFLGPCDQKMVLKQMRLADIFSVPAHKEGLGVANIEALAVGLPVVSTPVGGIPEVLDNGNNGWLCSADTKDALAKTIKDCIESPDERRAKSIRGRRFVEKNFNHYRMLEDFLKILQQTIDQ